MQAIHVTLDLLVRDEFLEDVIAQGFSHKLASFGERDGLRQTAGQGLYPLSGARLGGHFEDVFFDRIRKLVALPDALKARSQHDGERQVGVAGRIGAAELDPGGMSFARFIHRHANQR